MRRRPPGTSGSLGDDATYGVAGTGAPREKGGSPHEERRVKTAADIYRFVVDPDSDTAAANVLRFVGRDKSVLEIGAGPGSISRPLKEINGCRMSAVEIDEKSVEILRGFCEQVWRRDLHDPAWADGIPAGAFDNVVIADVLEHIVAPLYLACRAIRS